MSCTNNQKKSITDTEKSSYFDYSDSDDQITGGVKMIPIETAKGTFNVYTKRLGNNPKMRVLLLHGGPGGTHEEFGNFEGIFPMKKLNTFTTINSIPITATNPTIPRFGRPNILWKK